MRFLPPGFCDFWQRHFYLLPSKTFVFLNVFDGKRVVAFGTVLAVRVSRFVLSFEDEMRHTAGTVLNATTAPKISKR